MSAHATTAETRCLNATELERLFASAHDLRDSVCKEFCEPGLTIVNASALAEVLAEISRIKSLCEQVTAGQVRLIATSSRATI